MISVCFQGKSFTITVIQVYAPTSNAEEAEVEQFYEDLPDLLELTPKKDVPFTIGIQFSSVLSFSHVGIFANPWTAACQVFLPITNSRSLLKLKCNESVIAIQPFHPLSSPSPPALNLSQYQGLFQWVSSSH